MSRMSEMDIMSKEVLKTMLWGDISTIAATRLIAKENKLTDGETIYLFDAVIDRLNLNNKMEIGDSYDQAHDTSPLENR